MDERSGRIAQDPRYAALVAKRSRFGWMLSGLMLIVYFGFILLVAFDKALLAAPIGDGATSLGIPVGLGIIVFAILLTGVYVRRANGEFDTELAALIQDHGVAEHGE